MRRGRQGLIAALVQVTALGLVACQVLGSFAQRRITQALNRGQAVTRQRQCIDVFQWNGAADQLATEASKICHNVGHRQRLPVLTQQLMSQIIQPLLGTTRQQPGHLRLLDKIAGAALLQGLQCIQSCPHALRRRTFAVLRVLPDKPLSRGQRRHAGLTHITQAQQPIGVEALLDKATDGRTLRGRHPAVHAMGDDKVVTLARLREQLGEIGLHKLDIAQLRSCGQSTAMGDVLRVEIHRHELPFGIAGGQQQAVQALPTTQFAIAKPRQQAACALPEGRLQCHQPAGRQLRLNMMGIGQLGQIPLIPHLH